MISLVSLATTSEGRENRMLVVVSHSWIVQYSSTTFLFLLNTIVPVEPTPAFPCMDTEDWPWPVRPAEDSNL
jgi:hypothetical protein